MYIKIQLLAHDFFVSQKSTQIIWLCHGTRSPSHYIIGGFIINDRRTKKILQSANVRDNVVYESNRMPCRGVVVSAMRLDTTKYDLDAVMIHL